MHDYQNLMGAVHVPEELNERVLAAARSQGAVQSVPGGNVRPKKRSFWRAAVCAACALAVVAGGVTLRPRDRTLEAQETAPLTLSYAFGLTACAADVPRSVNGGIVFGWEEEKGRGVFRVTGEGIETVALAVDRGELWRAGTCFGGALREPFDPSAIYGLSPARGSGMDSLDGAALTMTVIFSDGAERSETYALTLENLRTSETVAGETVLVPALAGDMAETVSGLYAVPAGSTWLCWPVEGSNTVSLSNRYGYRADPGGETRTFHAGIDIPAEKNTPVLAAAAGTVVKAEFDADKGNYIVLSHGKGMETVYAQCLRLAVEVGDAVEAGQEIAAVGSTGKSTGPHLCFQVWQDGEAQNPVAYFNSDMRDTLKMG